MRIKLIKTKQYNGKDGTRNEQFEVICFFLNNSVIFLIVGDVQTHKPIVLYVVVKKVELMILQIMFGYILLYLAMLISIEVRLF